MCSLLAISAVLCLLVISKHLKLPCEYVTSTWPTHVNVQLNSREILVSTRYNFDMIIDAQDDTVSKSIQEKGLWQSTQIHVIAHFLKPDATVLNLGPQSGLEAILIGKLIGPKGRLYIA